MKPYIRKPPYGAAPGGGKPNPGSAGKPGAKPQAAVAAAQEGEG